MHDIRDSAFRFKWATTWPDGKPENDFAATDPKRGAVGRIYPASSDMKRGDWVWFMFAFGPCIGRLPPAAVARRRRVK